jgi:recombinational DNA repair protein (RecF pathway)
MPTLKDHVQVLSVIEQGNTSQVLVLLGERLGQIHVHAKGGRRWPKKGFEGGMDLLARGEIVVYPRPGEMLWLLKEWNEEARPRLGHSVPMLYAASFLSELTQALTRPTSGQAPELSGNGDASGARLYQLLAAAADALASGVAPGPIVLAFTLRALENEGLFPSLKTCDNCGKDLAKAGGPAWLTRAGMLCASCADTVMKAQSSGGRAPQREIGVRLTPDALQALIHVQATGLSVTLSPAGAEQLARALIVLIHSALEHDLRTLPAAARMVRAMGKKAIQGKRKSGSGSRL